MSTNVIIQREEAGVGTEITLFTRNVVLLLVKYQCNNIYPIRAKKGSAKYMKIH